MCSNPITPPCAPDLLQGGGSAPRRVTPGALESKDGKVKQLSSLLLGRRSRRERGGKACGSPPSPAAWWEGCCQLCLPPPWEKGDVTRAPPGTQPGARNPTELPPDTGLFWETSPRNCFVLFTAVPGQPITPLLWLAVPPRKHGVHRRVPVLWVAGTNRQTHQYAHTRLHRYERGYL